MTRGERSLWVARLGVQPYDAALQLQRALAAERIAGALREDVLLLLEHPPVVTLGRGSKAAHLTASPAVLTAQGVALRETERGGDVTFHGPGQLVGYPIIDLTRHRRDLHWYLRAVEEALILALGGLGLPAERVAGLTGVWTRGRDGAAPRPRKIASIGVHARDWVTWHGFALNVSTDLAFFDLIVPCGIAGVEMTSLTRELGAERAPSMGAVEDAVASAFGCIFALDPTAAPASFIDGVAAAASLR